MQQEMEAVVTDVFDKRLKLLTSIKGIGVTLATALIITTGGFTYFDNAKQLSRCIGICPRVHGIQAVRDFRPVESVGQSSARVHGADQQNQRGKGKLYSAVHACPIRRRESVLDRVHGAGEHPFGLPPILPRV